MGWTRARRTVLFAVLPAAASAALAVAPLTPVPVASASPGQAASVRLAAGRATAEADSAQSAAASPSWPSKTKGRLVVVFRAPAGVPAGLRVAGERQAVVTRPASGHTARVVLPPGRYRLAADAATVSGRTYRAFISAGSVRLVAGKTVKVRLTMRRFTAATDLAATQVSKTSASLEWRSRPGAKLEASAHQRRRRGQRPRGGRAGRAVCT